MPRLFLLKLLTICSKHWSLRSITKTLLESMRSMINKIIQWTMVRRIFKTRTDSVFVSTADTSVSFRSNGMLYKPPKYFLPVFVNEISSSFQKFGTGPFLGATYNTSAQRTIIGLQKAGSYCNFHSVPCSD